MMSRVRIDLEYDGTDFHGWQVQPGLRTVQGEMSRMLGRLLGRSVLPTGAGRTDAGVHARGQVCHVGSLSAAEAERLARALPEKCPADMEITAVTPVSRSFNARFSAIRRRYAYSIGLKRNVFRRNREWYVYWKLDPGAMAEAAAMMIGAHDYSSFCKTDSLRENNACDVSVCRFDWSGDSGIFHVQANRFLHHMVRTMVGTLIEVGRGYRRPEEIPEILAARDRSFAGAMAPPQGLCLEEVGYPEHLLDPEYHGPGLSHAPGPEEDS